MPIVFFLLIYTVQSLMCTTYKIILLLFSCSVLRPESQLFRIKMTYSSTYYLLNSVTATKFRNQRCFSGQYRTLVRDTFLTSVDRTTSNIRFNDDVMRQSLFLVIIAYIATVRRKYTLIKYTSATFPLTVPIRTVV